MHYMPVKLELRLGDNIKLYGSISDYISRFSTSDGYLDVANRGKEFRTWEKTGQFLSNINRLVLKPSNTITTRVPAKKRLLKHFYRPLKFNEIMSNLGFKDEDIELFNDYWEKNKGLVGRRDSDLVYELRDVDKFDVSTSNQNNLNNLAECLPVVIPVHFRNEDSEGWYGINMPTALKGVSSLTTSTWCNTDRYDNALMKHLRA